MDDPSWEGWMGIRQWLLSLQKRKKNKEEKKTLYRENYLLGWVQYILDLLTSNGYGCALAISWEMWLLAQKPFKKILPLWERNLLNSTLMITSRACKTPPVWVKYLKKTGPFQGHIPRGHIRRDPKYWSTPPRQRHQRPSRAKKSQKSPGRHIPAAWP